MTTNFKWRTHALRASLALVLAYCALVQRVDAQADILAVTSFRDCVQLDPTVQGKAVLGQQLDCSALVAGEDPPPVTTMDLQITPGLSTGSTFDIDLSVVLNDIGAASTTSTSPVKCTPSTPSTQMCRATTTAKMQIRTSKPVFAYDLDRFTSFEVPYCYASMVQFEQFASEVVGASSSDQGQFHRFGEAGYPCHSSSLLTSSCGITAQGASAPTDNSLSCMVNQNTALKYMLERMQFPYPVNFRPDEPGYVSYIPGQSRNFPNANDLLLDMGNGQQVLPYPTGENAECAFNECQGNLYTPTVNPGNPDLTCCNGAGAPITPNKPGNCENRNIDVRVPALRPVPTAFGFGPKNLAAASDDTTKFVRNETSTNVNVWNGEKTRMASVGCASPRCAANTDFRRIYGMLNSQGFDTTVRMSFNASRHLILPIAPTCSVYRVDVDARVIIDVEIDVTVSTPNPTPGGPPIEKTETLNLNNFNVGETSSSLSKLIRARFENIEATDSLIGPSISGYIVVCGRQGAANNPDFIDMRELISSARNIPLSEVKLTDNPWQDVIATWNQNAKDFTGANSSSIRKHFFPHPFDYVQPGVGRGKESGGGLSDDFAQSFWYFVPQDLASKEFGSGCNQIGVRSSFSSSVANQDSMCKLPAHECVPGIGKFFAGGRKTSVPCTVSSMFMYASGMQGEFQQGELLPNSRFSFTLDQAKQFMPNDEFDVTSGTGTTTQSSSPLYDSEAPNFWLSGPAPRLMYQPSGDQTLSSTVTAELVVDFVGTFVQYEETIALGQLVFPDGQTCKTVQGTTNETYSAAVENLSQPGAGVTTSYRVTMVCNETRSGLYVIEPLSGEFLVNDVAPGATSESFKFVIGQNGAGGGKGQCLMSLLSATDVVLAPLMDAHFVDCSIAPSAISPFPQGANISSFEPVGKLPPCKTCNLTCLSRQGGLWSDPCFLTIIIVSVAILAAVPAVMIMFIVFKVRFKARTLAYTQNASKEVDERVSTLRDSIGGSMQDDRQSSALIDREPMDEKS